MQPAHRRQDRGNSVGALHPEKVLSKAFRTRVRFPPPPPKRKKVALLCDLLSFRDGVAESNLPPSRQRWIWRRLAPPAGLDSRLHFCATFFLFMAMLPNRTCLHRVSDGYGGVPRRRRVSIPAYTFVRPSFFSWRCYRIEPASIASAMDMAASRAAGGSRFPSALFAR